MIKKVLILFLVTAFLNFMITPDFAFAESGGWDFSGLDVGPSKSDMAVAGLVVLGVIVLAVLTVALIGKHKKESTEQPKDQGENPEISSEIQLDQPSTQMSYETNDDDQRVTPSGQLVLLSW